MRSRTSSLSVPNPYRNVGVSTAVPAEQDETRSRGVPTGHLRSVLQPPLKDSLNIKLYSSPGT